MLPPFHKNETENRELHNHRYQHHQWRSNQSMDTQMDEDNKQHDVQHIVHPMTTCKAHEVLPRGSSMEREVVGGEEVIHETHQITHRIGDIQVNPEL